MVIAKNEDRKSNKERKDDRMSRTFQNQSQWTQSDHAVQSNIATPFVTDFTITSDH